MTLTACWIILNKKRTKREKYCEQNYATVGTRDQKQMFEGFPSLLQVFWGQSHELQLFPCSQVRAAPQDIPKEKLDHGVLFLPPERQEGRAGAHHFKPLTLVCAVQCRASHQSCIEREPLEKSHCQLNTCTDKGSLESLEGNCT